MTTWTNRHYYLVSYDVSDDDRRTRVFKTLMDFGNHVQYSVFLCQLTRQELVTLRALMHGAINHLEDQVMFVHFGPATHALDESVETIGRPYSPPGRRFVV